MKSFYIRGLAVILVIAFAVGFGFAYDAIASLIEKNIYPIPEQYRETITYYSEKYKVPERIIYATIKVESNFDSAAVSKAGAVGLMQLMPSTFEWLTQDMLCENLDVGMLYDPETNIRYGTYYLSYLYAKFCSWQNTFAAYNLGESRVRELLSDPDCIDGDGNLINIPVAETASYVKKMDSTIKKYEKLYSVK